MTSRGCGVLVMTMIIVVNRQLSDSDAAAVRKTGQHQLRQQASQPDQPPVSTPSALCDF